MSIPLQLQDALYDIRKVFEDAANPSAAPAMKAYMKDIAPYFGITAPYRKAIEKELFMAYKSPDILTLSELLQLLFNQPERELHYLAMDWLYHRRKSFTPATIGLIEYMLTHHSWWDTVDFLSARCLGYWAAQFPKEAAPVIRSYINSDNIWLNRSAILHQLFYKEKTDRKLLSDSVLTHASSKAFFIQKSVGWALRHFARTDPEWVREFVAKHSLAALSRREAMKHL